MVVTWKEALPVEPLVLVVQIEQARVKKVPSVVGRWWAGVELIVEGGGYGTPIGSPAADSAAHSVVVMH